MDILRNFLLNFVTTGPDGVTPGLATTEFWGLVAGWITLATNNYITDPKLKGLVLAAIPILYALFRSGVKALAATRKGTPGLFGGEPVALPKAA